ncbi:non-hydrolyzing UDP-N-acetylglucosamine 2-epimerase [Leucobacter sp. W1038]|uniref:non-hydrolyzing UDP-N-acetylglucosamine 2-epimerase n=1 Tax=Leucobacter sp. W1038 TaxID=3438281 RepID=UPI003D998F5C
MKVLSVVGARPQFVKLAPIDHAMREAGVEHVIVHTGQHYDPMLSDVFFTELGISAPNVHLGIGSGSHGAQTGSMLTALDPILDEHQTDWVLAYGDTNSTVAAALSAVKMHLPLAHLEAGLRSFNRRMPEEHNRVVTDHVADLLLAPTEVAMGHLAHEGLAARSVLVGDVMTDVLLSARDRVSQRNSSLFGDLAGPGEYYLATLHRADNTDDPERLAEIVSALAALDSPVILLAHPRLIAKAASHGIELARGMLHPHAPLGYNDLVAAALSSAGVITDSGGLQKEAFLLRVPCTTLRTETEWTETIDLGWNVLAQTHSEIVAAVTRPRPADTEAVPYGDGHAAQRVVAELLDRAR